MVGEPITALGAREVFNIFNKDIKMSEIKNMDYFIDDVEVDSLESKFKKYKTDFVYRDKNFGLWYNKAKKFE